MSNSNNMEHLKSPGSVAARLRIYRALKGGDPGINDTDKIARAVRNALEDCKIPTVGPGHATFRVDGNALYDRMSAIADMLDGG
jgi:hypothetical protein